MDINMDMDNKDYYMEEEIGDSGVIDIRNPIYNRPNYNVLTSAPMKMNVGEYFDKHSQYDEYMGDITDVIEDRRDVGDLRMDAQPFWDRMGNALVNNAAIFGTQVISGTVGLINGLVEAAITWDANRIWNNTTTNAMADIQNWVADEWTNYRGREYNESSIWSKMGNSVFWADIFQNLGYAEAALIPGMGVANVLSKIGTVNKLVKVGASSLIGAIGEASTEAVHNRKEEIEYKEQVAFDNYKKKAMRATSPEEINALNSELDYAKQVIEEDTINAGNLIFGANIAVLTLSNALQFGNIFSRGYSTTRRLLKNVIKNTDGTYGMAKKSLALLQAGGKKLADAVSEGTEEVAQGIISSLPSNYTDYNRFNESSLNSEKRELASTFMAAIGQTLSERFKDPEAATEFAMGFVTGAFGVPMFKRNKNGRYSFTLANSIAGELREASREYDREAKLVEDVNNRLQQSKELQTYYNGAVRHMAIQDDMNAFAEDEDMYNFKTAESAQFISDIMMFAELGDIDRLKSLINDSANISDEDIDTLIQETSVDGDGPFMDNGNPMDRKNVRDIINKKKDILLNKVDSYVKSVDEIKTKFPNLPEEAIKNAVFLNEQIKDHKIRLDDLKSSVFERIGKIFNIIPNNEKDKKIQEELRGSLTRDNLPTLLLLNPELINYLNKYLSSSDITFTELEKDQLSKDVEDVISLSTNLLGLNLAFKEVIENPSKSVEDKEKLEEKAKNKDIEKRTSNLKEALSKATSVSEISNILNSSDEEFSTKKEVLQSLEDEGNEVAKNYKEITEYDKEVKRYLNNLITDPQTLQDALILFTHHSSNSNILDEVANPNSVFINDETIFDEASNGNIEMSLTKFLNAQYAVQTAMSRVNNDNKFKDRFSEEYKKPIEKREGPVRGNNKEETGDSRTSTVPPVNNRVVPTQPEIAVGNITQDDVTKDNKATNDVVPTTRELDKKVQGQRPYYRPAIPELHIDASREGDFRPFYQVVAERESSVDFSEIYNYLRDAGAFDYLNASNLREGSELAFMIDPNFNDHTIFIVDKSNRQIVGSLDEGDKSVSRYTGLRELIDNIHKEFEGRKDKESKDIFIATPITRVSKVMVGKIPYGTETRSLAEISGVLDGDKAPIFGIIKNGTFTTNGKVDDNLVIKPVDMSNKEGRLYLLIPNGAGKYSPAAVRVKHFNSEEFDLDDASVASTPMGKSINSAIDKLVSASSQDEVSESMKDLAQEIHMQDVIITWFNSPSGNGIVVSRKVRNADGSYKMVTINGKERIQESKTSIYYNEKGLATVRGFEIDEAVAIASGYDPSIIPMVPKNSDVIRRSIINALQSMNLPLQVSVGRINNSGYNKRIINSGITTSNILEARTLGTWFITDYFDKDGNLHQATSPASVTPEPRRKVETPVGGKESAIEGVPVTSVHSGKSYYVDLKTNIIRDNQGQVVNVTPENRILFDIAWANSNYGDATVGYNMMDNKVILPNGAVLNRSTQKYITGDEAKNFKATLERTESDRKARIADSKRVIGEIEESQKRVDKSRTDGEFYYILEDDGQYHEYTRVHSRLGSNSVESPKLVEEINKVKVELQRLVGSPANYDSYLTKLSNKYNVDLSSYKGMTDVRSRETIANIVRDSKLGSNSQRALEAGSAVDSVIRQFFTLSDTSSIVRPENISEEAFTSLINSLIEVKSNLEQRGETFLTNNIVLFHQYADGSRVAGEVDILAVDKDGNFKIYDVKTSRYSFYKHKNRKGREVDYFSNRAYWQRMSQRDYYTQQLSAYKNLFESQYGAPVTQLAIMPFVLGYSDNTVSSITAEKGISINYSASTPVPLAQRVEPVQAFDAPIFNSTLELQNPVNSIDENSKVVLPNRSTSVGYYELEGKLHKGYLTEIGSVAGVKLHVMKIPNVTTGFGNAEAHVASASYGAVFPNGQTVVVLKNSSTDTDVSAVDKVFEALEKNPNRVVEESSKETILSKSISVKQGEQLSAFTTIQREQAIMEQDIEFEGELDLDNLRKVDGEIVEWNKEEELAWLDKVLPQMSRENRVIMHKGIIKASGNIEAWGAFNKGFMILSDKASSGTVYHEAFHVVSNTILTEKKRAGIYTEARKKFGDLSDLEIEEALAEDFRVWVQNGAQDTRTLGRKILDFFKELLSFLSIQPSLTSLYVNINKGKYAELSTRNIRKGANTIDFIDNGDGTITLVKNAYEHNPKLVKITSSLTGKSVMKVLSSERYIQDGRWVNTQVQQKATGQTIWGYTNFSQNHVVEAMRDIEEAVKAGISFDFVGDTPNIYYDRNLGFQFFDLSTSDRFYNITKNGKLSAKDRFLEIIQSIEGGNIMYREIPYFQSLSRDLQEELISKGWSVQKFNSVSQKERDKAVECISF